MKAIAYDVHHFHTYQNIQQSFVPCGWGGVIFEENIYVKDKGDQLELPSKETKQQNVNRIPPQYNRATIFSLICHLSVTD